ncbi:MAG: mannose-6-phosphate isomerase, partial [Candidatus Hydrogenedentes bacterium]|nr:mannose-6-phosphate isomerase [Candidatus Hydrogenedentota bacterium]
MPSNDLPLLWFRTRLFERIWGGRNLRALVGPSVDDESPAPGKPVGEAWLISDHASYESVVAEGERAGATLHQLVEECPRLLLGNKARVTIHGRFPLLLKILDS